MGCLAERPIVYDGEPPRCSSCPELGFWGELKWAIGIGWKHVHTIRHASDAGGSQSFVTEYRCWHHRKNGWVRYLRTSYYTPPRGVVTESPRS